MTAQKFIHLRILAGGAPAWTGKARAFLLLCLGFALAIQADGQGAAATIRFQPERGLYASSDTVELALSTSPPNPSLTIWYTLNGEEPHNGFDGRPVRGQIYQSPLKISESTVVRARAYDSITNGPAGASVTHTYLFLPSLLSQPPAPNGYPSFWLLRKADYEMDTRVLTNTAYSHQIATQWSNLPIVALTAPIPDWFGTNGIYPNSDQSGTNWERAASLEFLPHPSWGLGGQINAGVQILGETSRDPSNPKHSLRVSFKSRYGPARLEFPVFTNTTVTRFDTLDLLAGSFDCVTMNFQDIDLKPPSYARDAWLKKSQLDMGQPGIHTRFAHLYINGLYWGLYHLGERPDAGYADEYLDGKKSDFDVLKHEDTAQLEVVDGNREAWDAMVAIASLGLTNNSQYAAIQQFVDPGAFADYLIVNMHSGNGDWPQKNWYAVRKRSPGEPFRFFCWDGDAVLGLVSTNVNKTTFATTNTPAYLYSKLIENAEFRQLFGDRIQSLVFQGGPLSIEANAERLRTIASEIETGIVLESARWGDANFKRPGRLLFLPNDHWFPEIDRMLREVIPNRHVVSMRHFKAAGLYPTTPVPVLTPEPGWILGGEEVRVIASGTTGTLLVTTNGVDPRLPGGLIHPSAFTPTAPIRIDGATWVQARMKDGDVWSALVLGRYVPIAPPVIRSWVILQGQLTLDFEAKAGVGYVLEKSLAANSPSWILLQTFAAEKVTRVVSVNVGAPVDAKAFYRLRIVGKP